MTVIYTETVKVFTPVFTIVAEIEPVIETNATATEIDKTEEKVDNSTTANSTQSNETDSEANKTSSSDETKPAKAAEAKTSGSTTAVLQDTVKIDQVKETKPKDTLALPEEEIIPEPSAEENLDTMLAADTGPIEIAGPATASWEMKADADTVNALFEKMKQSAEAPVTPPTPDKGGRFEAVYIPPLPPPPPVKVKIGKMGRDGLI